MSPSSLTPDPEGHTPSPIPPAVERLKFGQFPERLAEALCAAGDADREIDALRPLVVNRDRKAYEAAASRRVAAYKVIATFPRRNETRGA